MEKYFKSVVQIILPNSWKSGYRAILWTIIHPDNGHAFAHLFSISFTHRGWEMASLLQRIEDDSQGEVELPSHPCATSFSSYRDFNVYLFIYLFSF